MSPAVQAPVTSLCADSAVSGAVRAIRQAKLAPASPQAPRRSPQGLPSTKRRRRRLSMAAAEGDPNDQQPAAGAVSSQWEGQGGFQPEHGGQPAKRQKVAGGAPCTRVLEQPTSAALSGRGHSLDMPASAEQISAVCGDAAGPGRPESTSACAVTADGSSHRAAAASQQQTQVARDDTAEVAPPDTSPIRASTPTSSPGSSGKRTKAQARLQGLALQSGTPIPDEGWLKEAAGTAARRHPVSQPDEQAVWAATAAADGAAQPGRRLGDTGAAAQSVLPVGASSGGQSAAAASAGHAGASNHRTQGAVDPRRIALQAVEGRGSAAQQSQPLSLAEQAREAGSAAAAAAGSGSRELTHPSAAARGVSSQCASDPAASVAAQAEASGHWSGAGATESAAAEGDDGSSSSSSMATGSDVGSVSDEDSDGDSEKLEEAAAALGEDQEAWWQDFIASKEQLLTVLQVGYRTATCNAKRGSTA